MLIRSFFSRFGSDLERLVRGRFDSIERKIDKLEFLHWKTGKLRSFALQFELREPEDVCRAAPEHFRILIELRYVKGNESPIVLGGRDDFKQNADDGTWCFGVKSFIWLKSHSKTEQKWLSSNGDWWGRKTVSQFSFGCIWIPRSPIHVVTLEGLQFFMFATENIAPRLSSVRLIADSKVVYEQKITSQSWGPKHGKPVFSWPGELTPDEKDLKWCWSDGGSLNLETMQNRNA